jgi:hypothetical protein
MDMRTETTPCKAVGIPTVQRPATPMRANSCANAAATSESSGNPTVLSS